MLPSPDPSGRLSFLRSPMVLGGIALILSVAIGVVVALMLAGDGDDGVATPTVRGDLTASPVPEEEEETPPPPETTPGEFEILSHSMSGNKVVSIQAKNTGGSISDWVKITVEFLDSAGEWLCSYSLYEYDIAPGQTYDFEVAAPCSSQQVTDYNIEVEEHYWGEIS